MKDNLHSFGLFCMWSVGFLAVLGFNTLFEFHLLVWWDGKELPWHNDAAIIAGIFCTGFQAWAISKIMK